MTGSKDKVPRLGKSESSINTAWDILKAGLGPYVIEKTGDTSLGIKTDVPPILRKMVIPPRNWDDYFWNLGPRVRSWVHDLREFRNIWGHRKGYDDAEVVHYLWVMASLLKAVSAQQHASEVEDLYVDLARSLYGVDRPEHQNGGDLAESRQQMSDVQSQLVQISDQLKTGELGKLMQEVSEALPLLGAINSLMMGSLQGIDTQASHVSTAEVGHLSDSSDAGDPAVPINWNIRQPEYFVNRGRSFLAERNYDEAIECFHWAIHLNPNLGDEVKVPLAAAYGERGNFYHSVGEFQLALADYETALELNPTFAGAFLNRGNAWAALGELDGAISDYRKALEIDPGLALAHAALGIAYMKSGILDQAVGAFDRALEIDQRRASFYLGRGNVYLEMGEMDLAIDDYNAALEIEPGYPTAYLNRGVAYRADGEYDLAIAGWDKLIEIMPEFVPAYSNRGGTYALKGDYDSAISDFDMVLALDKDNPFAHCGKGNCLLLGKGEFELAIEEYEKVIAVSGDDELVGYARRSLELAVRLREELAQIDKFIEGDQDNPEGWHLRGLFYLDLGILPRADDDLSEAIRRREDYAEAYFDRARVRMSLVGIGGAISDYTEAIRHNPDYAGAYIHRALCYYELGEMPMAKADRIMATKLEFKPEG